MFRPKSLDHTVTIISRLVSGIFPEGLEGNVRRDTQGTWKQLIKRYYAVSFSEVAQLVWGYEQADLEEVNTKMSESPKLHLQRDLKVLRKREGFLDHQDAAVLLAFGGEVASLVTVHDGHLDVVPERRVGRAHAEDVGGNGDFGGECQVVVGNSHRQGQTLASLITRQALTATARRQTGEREKREGLERCGAPHAEKCVILRGRGLLEGEEHSQTDAFHLFSP